MDNTTKFKFMAQRKKIAIWGWWQGRNLGDLWILESLKRKFPGIIPITTEEEDFSKYDFMIIGGGGLLNGPRLRAPYNKPIPTQYGSFGLGGEFDIKDKELLQDLINSSQFFGVRDKHNMETYSNNQVTKLEISGDCTFMFPLRRYNPNKLIKTIKLIWRDPFGLLKWDKSKHHQDDGLVLNEMFGNYLGPIPFNDNLKCLKFYTDTLKKYGNVIFDNYVSQQFDTKEMYDRFKGIDLVVTMRYHGVVAAVQLGIPCIGLDIYPKVRTIMTDVGLEKYCIKLNDINKINSLINDIKTNWEEIRTKMDTYTKKNYVLTNKFANNAVGKILELMK